MSEKSVRSSSKGDRLKQSLGEAANYYAYDAKFTEIAQEANKANSEGNHSDALRAMVALDNEVRTTSSQFGMSDEQVVLALNKYHMIASLASSPNTANTANATGGSPIEQPGKTEGELEGRIRDLEDQFADAKLAVETSLLKRLGGKKKRQKLEEIEQKLREAYAEKWTMENGEFTDGAIQQCAYSMLVALDDVDKKVADKLKDREKNRGWFRRAAAAIGGWFAKGKPRTFMSGMGVGIATSLAGVWPLTTGAGLVATLGVKLSAKEHYLAERAKADHTEKTEDEQRRAAQKLVGSIETAAKSNETKQDRQKRVITALAGEALKRSVESSLNKRDDLVKEVRRTAGVFGAGFLTGGLVGHAAQNLNLLSSVSDQMAGKVEAATANTGDQGSVMDGFRGMKEEMINRVHEAQAGAAKMDAVDSMKEAIVSAKMDAVDSMKEAMIAQAQEARDAIANAANINILPTDFSNYDFPWDWAVEKFGEADAGPMLERLSEIAADNGHKVQWFGAGPNRWVEVDGTSATKEVLEVLGRYTGRL